MNNFWLKFKIWTKTVIASALVLYALLFIYNNSGEPVQFWWWFNHTHPTSVFFLTAGTFFAGVIATILASTTWKTVHQIRELRARGRHEKLERDVADMKSKAAMLQTKPTPAVTGSLDGGIPPGTL